MSNSSSKVTILFIQPRLADMIALDTSVELRNLRDALLREVNRDALGWQVLPAARVQDLAWGLRTYKPQIIHYAGHGSQAGDLYFDPEEGDRRSVALSAQNFAETLRVYQGDPRTPRISLVVLAGCYTDQIAMLLARYVDCAIGMDEAVGDVPLARHFTPNLYAALADGRSVQNAVESAIAELRNLGHDEVADAVRISSWEGVDPAKLVLTVVESSRPGSEEPAANGVLVEPMVQLVQPPTIQRSTQRLLGRMLLFIALLTIATGIIVANRLGLFTASSQFRDATGAQGANTPSAAVVSNHTITSTLTISTTGDASEATIQPATSSDLSGIVVVTEHDAVVTAPIHLELVRIPGAGFLMGSNPAEDPGTKQDETPQLEVSLPEFFIGKHEVTNKQYEAFVEATDHRLPLDWERRRAPEGKENHPVVYVSWNDAVEFTKWLSEESGRSFRLPTEAEWEKACRGTDGLTYPWGDVFDVSKANTLESNHRSTTEVGKHTMAGGDSPYKVADMAGNVWEWTNSRYWGFGYPYIPSDGREDMSISDTRTLRGGSFNESAESVRCAVRHSYGPEFASQHYGFRIVMTSP